MVEILVGDAVGDDDDADIGRTELVVDDRAFADQRIELLSAEFDQQRQLAAIERLIGGDL